jgi:hypothetical protein
MAEGLRPQAAAGTKPFMPRKALRWRARRYGSHLWRPTTGGHFECTPTVRRSAKAEHHSILRSIDSKIDIGSVAFVYKPL